MLFPISLYIFYWRTNRSREFKYEKIHNNHYFAILDILIKKKSAYIQVHLMWKGSIKTSLIVNTSIPLLWEKFHQHFLMHTSQPDWMLVWRELELQEKSKLTFFLLGWFCGSCLVVCVWGFFFVLGGFLFISFPHPQEL